MDKKELQNLIDRISLTGPEGIKKIKKVLKELNNGNGGSSSGSMGEDEEYTIAQALNDLNERIIALESAPVPQPETHILDIISISEGSESEEAALARLKLDGKSATKEQLALLQNKLPNVVIRDTDNETYIKTAIVSFMLVSGDTLSIVGGYYSATYDGELYYVIDINGSQSIVKSYTY